MVDKQIEMVVVIGAGLAGLAAGHALSKVGVSAVLLEKEARLAEPWRRRHKNLSLNTHRDLSALPGVDYPEGTPAFPPRDVVVRHLEQFKDKYQLPVQFGVSVEEVIFTGDHWAVHSNAGVHLARHVVIATGRDQKAVIPPWPGMQEFVGQIIHSADFGDRNVYAGRKILVVGAGNSGFDVLNHLVGANAENIWLSARNGPSILPKRIGKIAVQRFAPLLARLPLKVADALIAGTQRLVFGDLTRFRLPPAPSGGASRLQSDHIAIATDDGAIQAIKAGKIIVVPAVHRFDGDRVIMVDGTSIDPDIVIAATGYSTGLNGIVGRLGVLNANGVPLLNGGETSRNLPGLWFIGMRPGIEGYFASARVHANVIAREIARTRSPEPPNEG